MISEKDAKTWDVKAFFDTDPFWVIWQVGRTPRGERRIRRITQNYGSAALANADAERFRKSGVVTWVEEARPLAPLDVPQAAIEALKDATPAAPPSAAATALAAAW